MICCHGRQSKHADHRLGLPSIGCWIRGLHCLNDGNLVQVAQLAVIWISHKHADHMLGLPSILRARPAASAPLLVRVHTLHMIDSTESLLLLARVSLGYLLLCLRCNTQSVQTAKSTQVAYQRRVIAGRAAIVC